MPDLKTKKQISEYLRKHNISPTAQRVEMAHMLLKRPQHLSADDIYAKVNDDFAKASRATIYNNLNLFVEAGILKKLNVNSGLAIYDTNSEPHYHVFSDESGEVHDLSSDEKLCVKMNDIADEIVKKVKGKGYSIKDIQISFEKAANG